MKILTDTQIKEADQYTIQHEPISSVDLMERASHAIAQWICEYVDVRNPLFFAIGKGNNGGDGLAVARILYHAGYNCTVYLPFPKDRLSEDSRINLQRLPAEIHVINEDGFKNIAENAVIIDALLGTGVTGELKEPVLSLIRKINKLPNRVISIDLPSGMKSEFDNRENDIIKASATLTLEFPKLAMLLPEAGNCCGDIHILPIGLDKNFIESAKTPYHYVTQEQIQSQLKRREKFAHKGTYGHALLICGSRGMTGAAVLATGGALRSGCGLVSVHLPSEERLAVQVRYPSALLSLDASFCFSELPVSLEKYTSIGIGSGLGQAKKTIEAFGKLLETYNQPMVIDADALNIIASDKELRKYIPANSILTPHLGELKRLVGGWKDEHEKILLAGNLAKELESVVVVKGAYSMICLPNGDIYFNSTGNSGMAKGGSGDVLTGFITGLLARGYNSEQAAILGVYFHGLAGDRASKKFGQEGMNSDDMIDFLSSETP